MKLSLIPRSSFHFTGLACLALAATAPLHGRTDETIRKTFDVAPGGSLVADISVGPITVEGTDTSQVDIEFVRIVDAGSREEEEEILREHEVTIDQAGNTITIKARGPRGRHGGSWWRSLFGAGERRKFELRVQVPREFNIDVKTAGGGIDIARIAGDVKARTSGGGMEFHDIVGDVDGRTSGGGIDIERCQGTVVVHTSGGGIDARDGEGSLSVKTSGGGIDIVRHRGDVEANTSGGGIHCDAIAGNIDAHTSGGSVRAEMTIRPTRACNLSTSGGSVSVTVPEDAALEIDAATSAGSVDSDLPVTVTGEHKRGRLQGIVNGGGPKLRLRTSAGSITINQGAPAVAASAGS